MRRRLAVVALAVVALAGCGGGDGEATPSTLHTTRPMPDEIGYERYNSGEAPDGEAVLRYRALVAADAVMVDGVEQPLDETGEHVVRNAITQICTKGTLPTLLGVLDENGVTEAGVGRIVDALATDCPMGGSS